MDKTNFDYILEKKQCNQAESFSYIYVQPNTLNYTRQYKLEPLKTKSEDLKVFLS